MKKINKKYSVVVVGGGMSGVCAAIASARMGVDTVLVHNRPVLGGNASSEVRMHIGGADFHSSRTNSRETGILEEILLDNKRVNAQKSYSEFDRVLWEKTKYQDNLDVFYNTHVHEVDVIEGHIESVSGFQSTTEKLYTFSGKVFIDTTGDALVANLAGAEIMYGSESKGLYGETHAPETSNRITMGLTLLFTTKDMKRPVPFEKPDWAYTYTEDQLKNRSHQAHGENYWWIELGGDALHTIYDGETIRDELLKAVYGVWDHIKNGGDHGADHYALDWVGFLPGKRESRRVVGDYVLNENDLKANTLFDDVVAYGGWPMDMHGVGGLKNEHVPTEFIDVPEIYGIPYRALYSRNNDNLLMGGRAISVSKMAFGSTRLMGTCSVIGQAIGTAAGLSILDGVKPKQVNIKKLQYQLYLDDAFLPKLSMDDPDNLALSAEITASNGKNVNNVVDGVLRDAFDDNHGWEDDVDDTWLQLKWPSPVHASSIRLYWDTNLSRQIMLSLFDNGNEDQLETLPPELVESYEVVGYLNDEKVFNVTIENNKYRLNILPVNKDVNRLMIMPKSTYGSDKVKLFEVKVY